MLFIFYVSLIKMWLYVTIDLDSLSLRMGRKHSRLSASRRRVSKRKKASWTYVFTVRCWAVFGLVLMTHGAGNAGLVCSEGLGGSCL